MTDNLRAELIMEQSRVSDLSTANETLREERDEARRFLEETKEELAKTRQALRDALATVDRLRIHLQQGVEL
jgi:anion-transporting  ArsA/GET3 family ATPase